MSASMSTAANGRASSARTVSDRCEPSSESTSGVGASVVGPAGGEILGHLALAVHAEVPAATLRTMIYAYPTFHRAIESALDDLG